MSPTSTSEASPPAAAAAPPATPTGLSWRVVVADHALAVGMTVVMAVVVVAVIVAWTGTVASDPGPAATQLPAMTLGSILGALLAAVLVWAARRPALAAALPRQPAIPAYLLALVVGFLVQGVSLATHWLLMQFGSGLAPSNAAPLLAMLAAMPVLGGLAVVVVGPFAEELLFRHVLLRRFALAGRGLSGVLVTSVVFALLHDPWPGAQPLLVWLGGFTVFVGMGVGFGAVYLRTGRLGAAFAAHATCNLLALTAMAYSSS